MLLQTEPKIFNVKRIFIQNCVKIKTKISARCGVTQRNIIIISFLLSEIKSYRSAILILKISQSAVPKRLRNTAIDNIDDL
jgi:hypothetical protein